MDIEIEDLAMNMDHGDAKDDDQARAMNTDYEDLEEADNYMPTEEEFFKASWMYTNPELPDI